jgi:hypothetical protein
MDRMNTDDFLLLPSNTKRTKTTKAPRRMALGAGCRYSFHMATAREPIYDDKGKDALTETPKRIMQNSRRPFFGCRRCLIGFLILGLFLVAVMILWPWLSDVVTREHHWKMKNIVVDGRQIQLNIDFSQTRRFGDPRAFSIGGGNFLYRAIIAIDGKSFADVTTSAKPLALWFFDGKWYLAGYQLSPEEWFVLRLDGGTATTRVLRDSLPKSVRAWNLVAPDQEGGCQDDFDNKRTPG